MVRRKKSRSRRTPATAALCELNSPFIILATRSTPSTRHFHEENGEESADYVAQSDFLQRQLIT